jgi:hypothetical protein
MCRLADNLPEISAAASGIKQTQSTIGVKSNDKGENKIWAAATWLKVG